jgi:hypothetical protein
MVVELISTIFGSVLSGGATGLLGVVIQRYFDKKAKDQDIEITKLNHANSIELAKMESEKVRIRSEADEHIANEVHEASDTAADYRSLEKSIESDKASYSTPKAQLRKGFVGGLVALMMAFVDFMRGILRPGMTAYLCYLVTVMFYWAKTLSDQHGLQLSPDQIMQLLMTIIGTITYVFTTCALWWFGARPPKKGN